MYTCMFGAYQKIFFFVPKNPRFVPRFVPKMPDTKFFFALSVHF